MLHQVSYPQVLWVLFILRRLTVLGKAVNSLCPVSPAYNQKRVLLNNHIFFLLFSFKCIVPLFKCKVGIHLLIPLTLQSIQREKGFIIFMEEGVYFMAYEIILSTYHCVKVIIKVLSPAAVLYSKGPNAGWIKNNIVLDTLLWPKYLIIATWRIFTLKIILSVCNFSNIFYIWSNF